MSLRIEMPESASPTRGLLEDHGELLDQFVAEYEREIESDEPEMPDFFYTFLPSRMLTDVLATHPALLPREGLQRVMAVSGYYGGVFLRKEMRRTQLESMTVLPGIPIGPEAFEGLAHEAKAGADAAVGPASQALDYLELLLDELVAFFARTRDAVLSMMEANPRPEARDLLVPGGLLWCGYHEPRLAVIAGLHGVSRALESDPDPRWRALAKRVRAIQDAPPGDAWDDATQALAGTAVFEQLMLLSAAYTECSQAAALLAARALVYRDGATARAAALTASLVLLGNKTYSLGLMDSTHDASSDALPKFMS